MKDKPPKREGNTTDDGLMDGPKYRGPLSHWAMLKLPKPKRTGQFRDGLAFERNCLDAWIPENLYAHSTENAFMNVIEQLKGNYDEANELWKKYEGELASFRSAVKNDVASLEASARKTSEAVQKLNTQYKSTMMLLNSPEMEKAVENAERLALAVQSLSGLQSNALVFSVGPQSGGSN